MWLKISLGNDGYCQEPWFSVGNYSFNWSRTNNYMITRTKVIGRELWFSPISIVDINRNWLIVQTTCDIATKEVCTPMSELNTKNHPDTLRMTKEKWSGMKRAIGILRLTPSTIWRPMGKIIGTCLFYSFEILKSYIESECVMVEVARKLFFAKIKVT